MSVNSFAQKISEEQYNYQIFDIEYEIIQWNINNNTNEKMLLWLEKDSICQKMSIEDKIKTYFFSVKGDFSLINVISEYGSTLMGFKTDLFYTFYKIIEPKGTFSIQIICKPQNNSEVVDFLKNTIIMTTPTQIKKKKWNIFMISGLERLSFQSNALVITYHDLILDHGKYDQIK
jgi:hypothetical protein